MMSVLNKLITTGEGLQHHVWTVPEIRSIPNEALARLAFQSSETLRKAYLSESLFVSHWAGQRRQFGPASQAGTDAAGPLDERQLKNEWETSSALRQEFNNSFNIYVAFLRADRQGVVRIA